MLLALPVRLGAAQLVLAPQEHTHAGTVQYPATITSGCQLRLGVTYSCGLPDRRGGRYCCKLLHLPYTSCQPHVNDWSIIRVWYHSSSTPAICIESWEQKDCWHDSNQNWILLLQYWATPAAAAATL